MWLSSANRRWPDFPISSSAFRQVVGWQLEQMYPNRKIVLDDVSAVGLNLRTALARLAKLPVRPQLLLLYSGHNEFFYDVEELATHLDTPWERFDGLFEWSPLFRVLDRRISRQIAVHDVDEGRRFLVDRPVASSRIVRKAAGAFGGQLEQLALWCQRLKIDGLWFVPAGTEADYPPNRSTVGGAPTERQREEIESISKEARRTERRRPLERSGRQIPGGRSSVIRALPNSSFNWASA